MGSKRVKAKKKPETEAELIQAELLRRQKFTHKPSPHLKAKAKAVKKAKAKAAKPKKGSVLTRAGKAKIKKPTRKNVPKA